MTTAHLLHGFNISNKGRTTTDKLRPYLERIGLRVREMDYGWLGLLGVRLMNGRLAKRLAAHIAPGDIGVGHSNGCAILARAADMGAAFSGLVFLNPALDADRDIAPAVQWIHVYYNKGDEATRLSAFLLAHQWGDMGLVGYCGDDPRVRNYDCSMSLSGHSAIFSKLATWGPVIADNIRLEWMIPPAVGSGVYRA